LSQPSRVVSPLTNSWSARLALASCALLTLIAVWLLVRLVWLLITGPQVDPDPVPPIPRISQSANLDQPFQHALFGATDPVDRPTPVVATTGSSSLRLRGMMSGDPGGFAVISDAAGDESVYRTGDELPDGSVLAAIEAQRVIIDRNGEREALQLDRERSSTGSTRPASRPTSSAPVATSIPGLRGFDASAGASAASFAGRGSAAAGRLDASSLARQISVMPVTGGGFRVRPGRDARLFSELGLQINDIVTKVNGQPLQSESDARALFADVMRRGEVAITVTREGREMTLRPDLENIMRSLQNQ
jgi:general secretion pathway protein C